MANLLSKLKLHVKDYSTNEEAEEHFFGEVVSLDFDLKTNLYRFFNEESGALMISIDFSKDKVNIQERNSNVNLYLELEENATSKCIYKFDEKTNLELSTKTHKIEILEDHIILDYDLFNPNDLNQPLTRNTVEINCEVEKAC